MTNQKELKRVLSFSGVTIFGLSFMAPATVFTTYGIAITSSGGMISTSYLITLLIVLLSAVSYARLSKEFPVAGSTFTYVQKIIGPKSGFLVGWTILLDYMLSPMISSLLFGIMFHANFPNIPMTVYILSFIVFITIINVIGIKIAANYNKIVVILQILFIAAFCVICTIQLMQGKGSGDPISLIPVYDPAIEWGTIIGIIPILFFSFLGFDAVTTLAEETINPKKVLPKAIYTIVLTGGILFVATVYFMQLIYPNYQSFTDPDAAVVQILQYIGGNVLNSLFLTLIFVSATASAISSGSSGARLLYGMGRDGILPQKIFGYISPRFSTPVWNILLISIVACSSIFLDLTSATHLISFGVLFGFGFVNIATMIYFYFRKQNKGIKGFLLNIVIPLLGTITTFVLLFALGKGALILGFSWLVIGFIYLIVRTNGFKKMTPTLLEEDQVI